jgi:NhaA family Na+:H+ antiporter
MATDIAFAVGILSLLGKRVPAALRVLLLALAIIDDLGAILVIAIFYSSGLSITGLLIAGAGIVGIVAMKRFGVRAKLAYILPALVLWAGMYAAGIHPTIAGVIVGLLTPARAWLGPEGFLAGARDDLERIAQADAKALSSHELAGTLRRVDHACREAVSPAESLIEMLHPWVAFVIMPIFALANAGVSLAGGAMDATSWKVVTGVAVGLVVGKPIGVLLASWLALRLRIATLPIGMGPRHLIVLGVVAGVGFTMALFIAQLAFADERLLLAAKIGVLVASGVAAVCAIVMGRLLLAPVETAKAAATADEAENATEA